ncbi:MAG TPA: oligopeptide transporter, OPT family [Burkholderiales bacterium]|jgi:putative OPT family oligopeptide transporter|nr:oligopeptide transporter, OPT family [Burkholderiales bacterium]
MLRAQEGETDMQADGAKLEFTLRGLILGVLITLVFTAANVYLGLKVGLTFATSIPAAVISMAVLSAFRDSTILENNIVQTVASAAGTLSAIIFVLPGLLIVGWWVEFPFWESFLICVSGGILGVLFTIPLRRAMVVNTDLPYPEGVAAAEVLEVGDAARSQAGAESREGLLAVVYGAIASTGLAILAATRIATAEFTTFFRVGASAASGIDMGYSLALVGAGYLVGLSVGMAMLVGLLISWAGFVPYLTSLHPVTGSLADYADGIWRRDVRFIGAGAIAVASVWTLLKLIGPVVSGVVSTLSANRARKAGTAERTDTDLSPSWIGLIALLCLAIIGWLLYAFILPTPLAGDMTILIATAIPFIFIGGFLIAAVCGYMAGLIGASNSPISGVGILAILFCSLVFVAVAHPPAEAQKALVAFALFATAIVFAIATISNNNLQDLKTGQLVKATPRAQQWALIVGVIAGAAVIPPVLNLLANSMGFLGAPNPHVVAGTTPLAAPQATLISALAQGVIGGNLNWNMIYVGLGLGVVLIAVDEALGLLKWLRLPPLAIGIGIYLPMSATLPVVLGAVIGHWYDGWTKGAKSPEYSRRLAVLVASGMIVGESLWGVINAGVISATGLDAPFALVPADFPWMNWIGPGVFAALTVILYGWMMRRARAHKPAPAQPSP